MACGGEPLLALAPHVQGSMGGLNPAAKGRAMVAIAHTLIVIVWHVLATGKTYTDLGPDFYATRSDPAKETRRLIAKLEALGRKVTLAPAA